MYTHSSHSPYEGDTILKAGDLETATVFEFKPAPAGSYYAVMIYGDELLDAGECAYKWATESKAENIVSLQSCTQIKCRGKRVKMFTDHPAPATTTAPFMTCNREDSACVFAVGAAIFGIILVLIGVAVLIVMVQLRRKSNIGKRGAEDESHLVSTSDATNYQTTEMINEVTEA